MTRTQDEIVARITEVDDDDWMGFRREVLIANLDFEHAKPYLKDGVTEAEWNPDPDIAAKAADYLGFAIGKIQDHRGISASRSVDKLREYAWLLGRDDVVSAMDAEDYAQYGAPKVKAFALGMGFEWPASPDLERMARGDACDPDGCGEGCAT